MAPYSLNTQVYKTLWTPALSMTDWSGECYDSLLMSLVKSNSNQYRWMIRVRLKKDCGALRQIVYVCHSEGDRFRCLWSGYGSRCQFECVKNCNTAGFVTFNSFLCVSIMVHHPKDIQPTWQLWEALESTWASIPVECFRHLVESMPQRIEAVLRAKGGATQY